MRASNSARPVGVVVLAAGKGTRFPGVPSKVLVPLLGRPLVLRVLDAVSAVAPSRTVVVVGHGKEPVTEAVRAPGVETVDQGEPRGTGHAVLAAAALLGSCELDLLVLNGDVPLVRPATLRRLLVALRSRDDAAAALLTAVLGDGAQYGRIVRDGEGGVAAIVEAADATPDVLAIREINVGAYAFHAPEIFGVLAALKSENAKGEVYLTDAVRALVEQGSRVEAVLLDDPIEGSGVNSAAELAALEAEVVRAGPQQTR